jgi:ketosteroid isomerase-like protein
VVAVRAAWIVLVVACGGSHAAPVAPATPPSLAASRDETVKAAFAALAKGDAAALAALVDADGFYARAADCPDAAELEAAQQRKIAEAIEAMKGTTYELVQVRSEASETSAGNRRNSTLVTAGSKFRFLADCTARTELLFHEVEASVRVTLPDRPTRTAKTKLLLVLADGTWRLVNLPAPPRVAGADLADALAALEQFKDKMCACKDKACAEKMNEEYARWGSEMAKNAGERPTAMSEEMTQKFVEAGMRYAECMQKAMGATP